MADTYDRSAAPCYSRAADRLLHLANVGPGDAILDLGCGSGNAAFLAAGVIGDSGTVVGVDLAEDMVALARAKAAAMGLRNVGFEVMDVRDLEFEDGSFDAAISCFGVPALGYRRSLREAYRVLHPGGRFVSCDWAGPGSVAGRALRESIARHPISDPPEELRRLLEARDVLRDAEEARGYGKPEEMLEVLGGIGFRDARTRSETVPVTFPSPDAYIAYTASWGDREREFAAMRAEDRIAVHREFREGVAGLMSPEGLVVPWELRFT